MSALRAPARALAGLVLPSRRVLSSLLALLALLGLAQPAQAQVRGLRWDDPTLAAAVADADLIVLARALRIARNGVAYEVERTIKGPRKDKRLLAVTGLHHPELRESPPVSTGDLDFLLLRGDPAGEGFAVPTPTFGRFPCRVVEGRPTVIASLGGDETFVRISVPQPHFESLVRGLLKGEAPDLIADAREVFGGERLPGPERVYWSLRCLGLFGGAPERDLAPLIGRALSRSGESAATARVRAAAAAALGKLAGKLATQTLFELLGDPSRLVQSWAAAALAETVSDKPGSKAFEQVVARLLQFAREASPRPTTYAQVEDPRRNATPAPLGAALVALARLSVPEGRELATKALHAEDLDTIDAGLSYFEARGDLRDVPRLIGGMRPLASVDRFVNSRFARVLSLLSGEDYGIDPAAWQGWWAERQAGPPTPTPTPGEGR